MPNADLHLSTATAFHGDVGSMSRSQSQNFSYNALGAPGQIVVALPTSHSVNENLSTTAVLNPTTVTQTFRFDESVSKSPKSGRVHCIPHKWEQKFNGTPSRCIGCTRPIKVFSTCQRCGVCKLRAHSECKSKVGNTCGLTAKHLKACIEHMVHTGNQEDWGRSEDPGSQDLIEAHRPSSGGDIAESSSSNSANSSTPSTPAWATHVRPGNLTGMSTLHPNFTEMAPRTAPLVHTESPSSATESLFTFPESTPRVPSIILPSSVDGNGNEACHVSDSDGGLRLFGSGDESDQNTLINESFDSAATEDSHGHKWDRNAWSKFTIRDKSSTTMKEDLIIPFDKVTVERSIGRGRFGEVFACDHYGEAAVKFLYMNHATDTDNHFEAFLRDVREVKLARHDRILAFFGCTMDRNTNSMGIVVDYCEGKPLHSLLHQRESNARMDFQKVVRLSSQICQGMSYLHNRKILHKDLRSKNIFITSKNNVVISDYSLINIKMLSKPSRKYTIITPDHWLSYLAPELIKSLASDFRALPFSEQSDVYAFGTIFYEFISSDFPFPRHSPDSIIWQVGYGIKPPIGNLNVCREAKQLLGKCWTHDPESRPLFSDISKMVEKLPRKHLCRIPSNPF
jgi:kinase suppressor of Ras 2